MATGKTIPPYPPGGCNINNFTAATAGTLIKTGPGILFSATVNTGATGASFTLWDSVTASGTKIGTFSAVAAGVNPIPAVGVQFNNGLTISITNAPDVSVGWF